MKSKKFIYISVGILSFILLIALLTYILVQPTWPAPLEKYHKAFCDKFSGTLYNHAMSDTAKLTRECEWAGCMANFLGGQGNWERIECVPRQE